MTPAQKALWQGSWKSAVSVVSGAVITNVTDPRDPIYSKSWFLHLGIACLTTLLFVEGRYFNQWANSGHAQPLPDAIADAKDAAKATEKAIAKVEEIAPKVPEVGK